MTAYTLTVSPDYSPEKIASWHIFNTWLQKKLGISCHLALHDSFAKQRNAIAADEIDLIYANPADAAMLVREKGFVAIAQPGGLSDEAVIAVAGKSAWQRIEDLPTGITIASSDAPDILTMGLIMLEPADIGPTGVNHMTCATYVLIAKALLNGTADVGIFPAHGYDGLSSMVRASLRPLVRSQISVVRHMLLAGPRAAALAPALQQALSDMAADAKESTILKELGISRWEAATQEDVEFMIDLIDTLID